MGRAVVLRRHFGRCAAGRACGRHRASPHHAVAAAACSGQLPGRGRHHDARAARRASARADRATERTIAARCGDRAADGDPRGNLATDAGLRPRRDELHRHNQLCRPRVPASRLAGRLDRAVRILGGVCAGPTRVQRRVRSRHGAASDTACARGPGGRHADPGPRPRRADRHCGCDRRGLRHVDDVSAAGASGGARRSRNADCVRHRTVRCRLRCRDADHTAAGWLDRCDRRLLRSVPGPRGH